MNSITLADGGEADEAMSMQAPPPPPSVPSQLEQAANDIAREVRAAVQESNAPTQGRTMAPQPVIDALRGQIAAETGMIERLTSQIEQSQERLTSLQGQMDRALGTSESSTRDQPPPPFPTDIPPGVQDIATTFFVTVAVILIGVPIVRAFARRMDRRSAGAPPAALPANLGPRLDGIEQAIEAVAIEVERISEGQRYTNKVMSEVRALPAPNPLEQWPPARAKDPIPAKQQGEG